VEAQGRVTSAHHTVIPQFLLADYPRIALASGPMEGRCTSAAGGQDLQRNSPWPDPRTSEPYDGTHDQSEGGESLRAHERTGTVV
jgi:hypothetical protein